MAAMPMNSSVLASRSSFAISSDLTTTTSTKLSPPSTKLPMIRAQQQVKPSEGRRGAMLCLAATLFSSALVSASSATANAGVIEDYLEKSKANKELNDQKRLATSGANFARAYTVEFGSCKFPENFTGCQDLAKQKKVPFISEDLELECKGKDKYKCGSNVFWKW